MLCQFQWLIGTGSLHSEVTMREELDAPLYIEDEHKKRRYRRISFTTYFH